MTGKQLRYLYNFLGLFLCLLPLHLQAQEASIKDKNAEFKNEFAVGIGLQGRKVSFGAMYARNISLRRSLLLSAEFSEIKSAKEKRNNTAIRTSNRGQSYIYGKINNLFVARFGIGQKFYFSDKSSESNIRLAFSYQGGFSLGLLKPYYLTLYYPTSNSNFVTRVEPYTAENSQYFLNPNNIAGNGGAGKGWGELSTKPGVFAKGGFWIDMMNSNAAAIGELEMGVMVDAFFSPIYILAETKANPVMFHVYATVYFGGRW